MIKIYSDGTVPGTRVFQEDGSEITGVKTIVWTVDAEDGGLAKATLYFDEVHVEVSGDQP